MALQRESGVPTPRRKAAASEPRLFDWLVYGLLMAYVWRIQDLYPILTAVKFPILVSVAALGVFFLDGHAQRLVVVFRDPIVRVATFILLWMFFSVPASVFPGLSFSFVASDHIKTFLMMVLIVASVRGFADVERLALAQMAGAGIYSFQVLRSFQVEASGRLGDLAYYDSNDLAMLIVCTLPFAVYFLGRQGKAWVRALAVICAGVFVVAIVRTGSRGGFLGLIAIAAYLVFAFRAIPARVRLGAVVGCTALLFGVAGPRYWEMMGTLLHPTEDYNWSGNNDAGRMAIWKRGMGYMASRPLLGVGPNAFPVAEGTISPLADRQALGKGLKWSAAHNSFVQIGAELGVPGLIAFVLLLWHGFRTAGRIARRARSPDPEERQRGALAQAMIASFVGYVVAGFFLSQAYAALLYASLGILTGYSMVVDAGATLVVRARPRPVRAWGPGPGSAVPYGRTAAALPPPDLAPNGGRPVPGPNVRTP